MGTHLDALGLTWTHLDSPGLTWTHLDSLGLTWTHLDSLEFTRTHLDSLEFTWIHLDRELFLQGKRENRHQPKGKGKRRPSLLRLILTLHPERAHARTTNEAKRFPRWSHSPYPPTKGAPSRRTPDSTHSDRCSQGGHPPRVPDIAGP